jgi:hypothetical protein
MKKCKFETTLPQPLSTDRDARESGCLGAVVATVVTERKKGFSLCTTGRKIEVKSMRHFGSPNLPISDQSLVDSSPIQRMKRSRGKRSVANLGNTSIPK